MVTNKSNLAYDYSALPLPKQRPAPELKPVPKPKAKPAPVRKPGNAIAVVMAAIVVFAVFAIIIMRFAFLAEGSLEINKLSAEVKKAEEQVRELRLELTMAQNLENVKQRAAELGMHFPDDGQIVYYDASDDTLSQYASASNDAR